MSSRAIPKAALAAIIFTMLLLIFLAYEFASSTPTVQSAPVVSNQLPAQPAIGSSPPTPVSAYCANGSYCTGEPVAPSDAIPGAIVCGGGNNQYLCDNSSGQPVWKLTGATCTQGMKGYCTNTSGCANGTYCDGTPIPISEAPVGVVVCGRPNMKYQCMPPTAAGGVPYWKQLDACAPGMLHGCS